MVVAIVQLVDSDLQVKVIYREYNQCSYLIDTLYEIDDDCYSIIDGFLL